MLDSMAVIAELLGVMTALAVMGESLRLLLSRFSGMLKNLDFIESFLVDVYLGGLIIYVLALPSLHLLDPFLILGLLSLSGTASIVYHRKLRRTRQPSADIKTVKEDRRKYEQALVFGMFLFMLCVQILPITSLIYGSVLDTSLHSILVQVILENKHIPYTLQPYLPEGIIYPQAAHVIFAFSADLTRWIAPQAVLYVTQLFNALTVIGAYFLARRLWPKRTFYLIVTFVYAFASYWPMFITWGANPFVTGFPLFLVDLGILFSMLFGRGRMSLKELCLVGILFGYSGAIIISFLQTLLAIAILGLFALFLLRSSQTKLLSKQLVLVFAVGFLPVAPFIYRFVVYYPYIGHNIGLPSDFIGYPRVQQSLTQGLQWAFQNLSPYIPLTIYMATICLLNGLLYLKIQKESGQKRAFSAALLILLTTACLGLVSFVPPEDINILSWGHQGMILVIGVSFFIALFSHHLFGFLRATLPRYLPTNINKPRAALLISVLVLPAVYAPFVYTRLTMDPTTLRGAFAMFAVTSNDDNDLMLWMRENLTNDAAVLVNKYEPGLFIPVVAHRKAIYATPGSQLSSGYQNLIELLRNDTLNATCYNMMKNMGITHIYVGSGSTYGWVKDYKWDPYLFLGNPNFGLIKKIGNAYLFEFSYRNSSLVFQDDFEHGRWYDYGWDSEYEGNGLGNVTETENFNSHSQKCLKITAQAVYTVSTWKYTRYVHRQIFVQNKSSVQFSFKYKFASTKSFQNGDTFAVVISNVYGNQSVIVTTPKGVYENYTNSVQLAVFEGSWSENLTKLWVDRFHSSFPASFLLKFVNYDFDGVENIAYVDDINVTAVPIR